jgi:ribosomal protein S18 acetylase RimI-like enzyme
MRVGVRGGDGGAAEIRPARLDDLESIERIALAGSPEVYRPLLGGAPAGAQVEALVGLREARPDPLDGLLVAEAAGEVVGFVRWSVAEERDAPAARQVAALRPLGILRALRFLLVALLAVRRYRPQPGEAYFSGLGVVPSQRGRGLGALLVLRAEDVTASRGCVAWTCFVDADNVPSLAIFDRLGYERQEAGTPRLRRVLFSERATVRFLKQQARA